MLKDGIQSRYGKRTRLGRETFWGLKGERQGARGDKLLH